MGKDFHVPQSLTPLGWAKKASDLQNSAFQSLELWKDSGSHWKKEAVDRCTSHWRTYCSKHFRKPVSSFKQEILKFLIFVLLFNKTFFFFNVGISCGTEILLWIHFYSTALFRWKHFPIHSTLQLTGATPNVLLFQEWCGSPGIAN